MATYRVLHPHETTIGDDLAESPAALGNSDVGAQAAAIDLLCRHTAGRIAKRKVPASAGVEDGTVEALTWHLRALEADFDVPDKSGREGHRWPASGLTHDDRRRLAILSNLSGIPTTELLHLAVGLLFKQTREAMWALVTICREKDVPIEELFRNSRLPMANSDCPVLVKRDGSAALASLSAAKTPYHQHMSAPSWLLDAPEQHHDVAAESPLPARLPPETPPQKQTFLF